MTKGERIKQLRESANLTLEELAKKLHTTKQTIYKYEKNIVTNIPSDRIEALAEVLDSTPDYIMGWEKITEEVEKKSDVMADITIRIGADADFCKVVKRNLNDEDYFELCRMLCNLNQQQLAKVKKSLSTFL